ncbi:hypothetical protein K432DRAFT_294385 [Lepidopterella palustris CBS 459.81]|uniref:Kinesin light chain n=1 Tax=Lepidopterella palustris CBS 459.81 TaxID=1314670 RepID=A0A8E2JGX8_9PEZI|nr:hypothetical protein K432DRAFT_294385 [Lepidopterella palustris CBS 459.81]
MAEAFPSGEHETWTDCQKRLAETRQKQGEGARPRAPTLTLTSVSSIGSALKNQCKYEAEAIHRRALGGYEKLVGPDHPHTLISMGNLVSAFWNQERLEEAQELKV